MGDNGDLIDLADRLATWSSQVGKIVDRDFVRIVKCPVRYHTDPAQACQCTDPIALETGRAAQA